MTCMLQPVSPSSPPFSSHPDVGSGGVNLDRAEEQAAQEEEEEIDLKLALPSEPIVGTDKVLADQHGPGAIAARALPTTNSPPDDAGAMGNP